jgi:hypothetical protein
MRKSTGNPTFSPPNLRFSVAEDAAYTGKTGKVKSYALQLQDWRLDIGLSGF